MEIVGKEVNAELMFSRYSSMRYSMPLMIFGKQAGTILISLDDTVGYASLHFITIKDYDSVAVEGVKASTCSNVIYSDLTIEEWKKLITDLAFKHTYSKSQMDYIQQYGETLLEIPKPTSSGCFTLIITLISTIFVFWLIF